MENNVTRQRCLLVKVLFKHRSEGSPRQM